jgi:capsular polysaccharide biosynthesis protein
VLSISQGAVVELTEAFQRIVRAHWIVIVFCTMLGVAGGVFIEGRNGSVYAASTRVALGSATPQTEAEAAAISSVAQAIVTSRSQVRDALNVAGVNRNAADVAANDVTVRPLGTSNVVEVVVEDHQAVAAQKVANSLGSELERTWLGIGHGQTPQVVKDLNARLDALNQKIGDLDSQINSTVDPGKGTDPVRTLLARREDLARQATALETERDSVVSQDAIDVRAAIIDRAAVPEHPESSGHLQGIFLGGLAGLVLGLGLAALLEALHPTLVGPRSIAVKAGGALLGRLEHLPGSDEAEVAGLPDVATRIRLAAAAARLDAVELVAAPAADLAPLAAALNASHVTDDTVDALDERAPVGARGANGRNGAGRENGAGRTRDSRRLSIRVFDRAQGGRTRTAGFVVVSPTRTRASALDDVDDIAAITGWRLLGVVTYDPPSIRGRASDLFRAVPEPVPDDETDRGEHETSDSSNSGSIA